MKVEIVRYTEEHANAWNELVSKSINGTFLHSRSFFDHNPLNKQDDCSFLYYKKNKVAGVIPCNLYEREGKRILHSYMRSTYGGFVVNEENGVEEAVEMVEKLIAEAKALDVQEIIIRNPFRIFQRQLCDETDYAMWYHGFTLKSRELEIAIDLRAAAADKLKLRYNNGTKYNVKKAVKFVQVSESDDYKTFWYLLEQNLLEKHGTKPVHSLDGFNILKSNVGDDKIKLFAGFVDNKMVCGVVTFLFRNTAIHAQYIGSDSACQDIRPLNAVIDYIIEWGHREKFEYFNLGTANEQGGRVINNGLFHFKEGFGGRGTLRETMSLTL